MRITDPDGGLRGSLIASFVGGAAVGALVWLVGLPPAFAVAAGLLVVLATVTARSFGAPPTAILRHPPDTPRPGTRPDVSRIAWGLHDGPDGIGGAGRRHLEAFARGRLARHGVDSDDPAAVAAMLGARAAATLARGGRASLAEVEDCLTRLEQLDTDEGAPRP